VDLVICFIDDSGFEHELVRNEIAHADNALKFVQAYTFNEAKEMLGNSIPGLFLLDLWGQDMDVTRPSITSREEMEEKVSGFNSLDYVYDGLDNFKGDKTNEYLKRLFSIVNSWRTLFESACSKIGQNNKYGIQNLNCVRAEYPGIPAVFYTRKSMINDAVAMFGAGADGLFIKPTGKNDVETQRVTREYAPELIMSLKKIINRNIGNLKKHIEFYANKYPPETVKIESLINNWKAYLKDV
jgi:DNA-binding NarL/FixJ family response regulator